jgi:hypothetical protein
MGWGDDMSEWLDLSFASVACAVGPSGTTFSTDFSFQYLISKNLFEFSAAEITSKSISPMF